MLTRASRTWVIDHPAPSTWRFTGLTIRTALLLGFGLTFGVWLFAGYYFTTRITEVEDRAAAINARYMQAQELLSTVRAQVLLESVYVRDALLDPDPTAAPDYRHRRRRRTSPWLKPSINTFLCSIPRSSANVSGSCVGRNSQRL